MPTKADIAMVNGLQAALDAKFSAANKPAVADVTGLQTGLDGKQPVQTAVADVTASRAVGSTYQNNGGVPRLVAVTVSPAVSAVAYLQVSIDGTTWVTVEEHSNQDRRTLSCTVPASWRYRLFMQSGTATLNRWTEIS